VTELAVAGNVAPGELEPGDEALVLAVLESRTYADAAKRCGVSERTIQRRLRTQAFRDAVTALAYERLESAAWRLFVEAPDAIETLRELRGPAAAEAGAGVRFKAAVATVELLHKVAATLAARQVEPRLARVEETLDEVKEQLREKGARGYR
jgi:hypothetical protein